MTNPTKDAARSEAEDAALEEAGGALATLGSIALFAVMIVFAIGCGLLGWFS